MNIASILIVLLVVIGVVRALHVVYKLVRKAARRGLSRLEAVIVDWNHDENEGNAQAEQVVTSNNDRLAEEEQHDLRARQGFVHPEDD